MANCLVTQLKETVANGNLVKMGYLKIKCNTVNNYDPSTHKIYLGSYTPVEISISGGTFTDSSGNPTGNTKTISSEGNVYVSNSNAIITLPKYNIYVINNNGDGSFTVQLEDIDCIGYSLRGTGIHPSISLYNTCSGNIKALYKTPEINTLVLTGANVYGDVSSLDTTSMIYCTLNNTKCTGKLNPGGINHLDIQNTSIEVDLSEITANVVQFSTRGDTNVHGNISSLFNSQVTLIDILNNPNVLGSVESGVEKAWNESRRSGNIQLSTGLTTSLTLKSSNLSNYTTDFKISFSENEVVVKNFETSTVYARYDGSTWRDGDGNPYTPNN